VNIEVKVVAPELAAALNNLAAAIAGKGVGTTDPLSQEAATDSPPAKGRKAKADAPAPSAEQPSAGTTEHTFGPTAQEQPSGEAKAEPTSASTEAAASDEPIPYDEVRKRILEIGAKKSRDAVLELLSEFGVSGGKDLKPDQYAEFVEAADKVLAS
jgi:predicted component of type VI protein secretion system